MRSFCSGQLPTKHGAAKHVGSEGHESKAGGVGGGEKSHLRKHKLSLMGRSR